MSYGGTGLSRGKGEGMRIAYKKQVSCKDQIGESNYGTSFNYPPRTAPERNMSEKKERPNFLATLQRSSDAQSSVRQERRRGGIKGESVGNTSVAVRGSVSVSVGGDQGRGQAMTREL